MQLAPELSSETTRPSSPLTSSRIWGQGRTTSAFTLSPSASPRWIVHQLRFPERTCSTCRGRRRALPSMHGGCRRLVSGYHPGAAERRGCRVLRSPREVDTQVIPTTKNGPALPTHFSL